MALQQAMSAAGPLIASLDERQRAERPQCAARDGRQLLSGKFFPDCHGLPLPAAGGHCVLWPIAARQRARRIVGRRRAATHERTEDHRRKAGRRSRAGACRAGAGLRHLHDVLQADRRRGAVEAARHLVSALRARQGLRHLRDAAGRVPHLLLPLDGREGARAGLEARALETDSRHQRRRAHDRLRRSGIARARGARRRISTRCGAGRRKARAPRRCGSSRCASARAAS